MPFMIVYNKMNLRQFCVFLARLLSKITTTLVAYVVYHMIARDDERCMYA